MNQLLNHMMLAFNRSQMNVGYPHLGIITSVNPTDYTVKVLLQPEEIETGFIPFCTLFYGWVAPPVGGEQCLVLFERGNNNVPVAALLLYWDEARAPGTQGTQNTSGGEILLKHSSGSFIKLGNNGKLLINGNVEIDVTTSKLVITTTGDVDITSSGGEITAQATTINLKGDVVIDGDLTANNGAISVVGGTINTTGGITADQDITSNTDVTTGSISLKTHVHSGVTTGGSNTGAPV